MKDRQDSILVDEVKQGNEQSFEIIYLKYHKQLYVIAFKYLRSQELAEDAVQDIFLKLWRIRRELDPSLSLRDFLFTILRNHVLNMIRNDRRRILKYIRFTQEHSVVSETPDDFVFVSECKEIIERGLSELPDGKRLIFRMRRMEGMSNDEIAHKLGISIFTVKTQLYHATKFMRDYLKIHAEI